MIAALYIDPRGPYPNMPNVDCWDVTRDARLYDGPHPVVAHPPCGAWGRLWRFHRQNDRDCALRAVEQVQAFGGVLEHPAHSKLWTEAGLPRPGELPGVVGGGFTLAVDQCAWGHVARKPTWIYCVGIDRLAATRSVRTGGTPTHWIAGSRGPHSRRLGARVPDGIKICSSQQRRRTPPAFSAWLVGLARSARLLEEDLR